jgi:GNAT superfamily N-acetyltransferase
MNDGLQPLELAHYARSMAGLIASWALERETQFAWAAHTFAFPVDGSALAAHVEVAQGRSTLVARRADDPPVAYVELVPDAANRSARVERLIVAPEQRRQGLGRSVLSLLVDTARRRAPPSRAGRRHHERACDRLLRGRRLRRGGHGARGSVLRRDVPVDAPDGRPGRASGPLSSRPSCAWS